MTEEQIRERNIAIAIFLQSGNVGTDEFLYAIILDGKAMGYYRPEGLKFHCDWNWLMPVVQKLYSPYANHLYQVSEDAVRAALVDAPIETVFKLVHKWIEKINNNEGHNDRRTD